MKEKKLKSFDWRSLNKYFSAQATEDLNVFLEKLPQNTNKTILTIAGIVWAAAGAVGLFTTMQVKHLTTLRAEFQQTEALKPMVPALRDIPVNKDEVQKFAQNASKIYKNLTIQASGSTITINAKSTGFFGQFREAVGHVQNGGTGWRVSVEKLCVGRECGNNALSAELKINKVSVDKPG